MENERLPQVGDKIRFRKGVVDAADPKIKMTGFSGVIVDVHDMYTFLCRRTMYGIDFDAKTIATIKRRYGKRWGDVESYTTWADDFDVIEPMAAREVQE